MALSDDGQITSRDGTKLSWRGTSADGAVAHVAIVHGYCEHSGRYQRTMEALTQLRISSTVLDLRGHGTSEGARTDVTRYDDYVADVDALWAHALERSQGRPTFALAHSMGGLVATRWAARQPRRLQGLILSSPFFGLASDPPALMLAAARVLRVVAPGMRLSTELKIENLSHDEAWCAASAEDPLYFRTTTARWFFATRAALRSVRSQIAAIGVPTLVAVAGEDRIVSTPVTKEVFPVFASSDKKLVEFPGYFHEILNESGRQAVLTEIGGWISTHL